MALKTLGRENIPSLVMDEHFGMWDNLWIQSKYADKSKIHMISEIGEGGGDLSECRSRLDASVEENRRNRHVIEEINQQVQSISLIMNQIYLLMIHTRWTNNQMRIINWILMICVKHILIYQNTGINLQIS